MKPNLEDVFKTSGIPTYTYVESSEYQRIMVSLRTPGRGLIIEGPSGIGKTTSVEKVIESLELRKEVLKLTARKKDDIEIINEIPEMKDNGIVIIDDFHKLSDHVKSRIADYMKTLSDNEDESTKIIIIGINKAGDSLVNFATDLNNRIDTIRFEINSREKIMELISKGERALNININIKEEIAHEAFGSFHLAQMICQSACINGSVTECQKECKKITISMEVVRERLLTDLARAFHTLTRKFAVGPRLRREGRAPYLHLLYWLAASNDWSIQIDEVLSHHPELKGSVGQVVDKNYLTEFLKDHGEFSSIIHYDPQTRILGAEDPKFVYYIRNILWNKFAKQVGYININFDSKYDFALSFAGSNRDIAEAIYEKLSENEIEVFYDKNEQQKILAENIEDYLGPIYRSEARYIIVILGRDYPAKIWTKFESDQFKERFGENRVILIKLSDVPISQFDITFSIGRIDFDLEKDFQEQIDYAVNLIISKQKEVLISKDEAAATNVTL